MSQLFDPIKAQANITDSVIVAFSGGKDSWVTVDFENKPHAIKLKR